MFTEFLKELLPCIEKVIYFSDGCAAQYKNRKNLFNLCQHKTEFGIEAEWNFFATSHGKSPCDAIGGTVKRVTARASLQRPRGNQILTPLEIQSAALSTETLKQVALHLCCRVTAGECTHVHAPRIRFPQNFVICE